jgi:hypothetical protein
MMAATRIAVLAAFASAGLCGCQPHRATSSIAALEPQAPVPADTAATTRGARVSTSSQAVDSAEVVPTSPTGRPATGRPCRVHLRRDAMGLATISPLPMGSRATSPSVRATQIEGVLDDVGDHWVTLRTADRVYSIPVGSILAIEFLDVR